MKILDVIEGKIPKTIKSKYHTMEVHNYWIKRNNRCLYCMNGSKPIHEEDSKFKEEC